MIFKKHRYKHYKEIVRCIKLYDDNGKRPIIFERGVKIMLLFLLIMNMMMVKLY